MASVAYRAKVEERYHAKALIVLFKSIDALGKWA
jgi:hypothetical protein